MTTQFHKMAIYGITALLGAFLFLIAAEQGLTRQERAYAAQARV